MVIYEKKKTPASASRIVYIYVYLYGNGGKRKMRRDLSRRRNVCTYIKDTTRLTRKESWRNSRVFVLLKTEFLKNSKAADFARNRNPQKNRFRRLYSRYFDGGRSIRLKIVLFFKHGAGKKYRVVFGVVRVRVLARVSANCEKSKIAIQTIARVLQNNVFKPPFSTLHIQTAFVTRR